MNDLTLHETVRFVCQKKSTRIHVAAMHVRHKLLLLLQPQIFFKALPTKTYMMVYIYQIFACTNVIVIVIIVVSLYCLRKVSVFYHHIYRIVHCTRGERWTNAEICKNNGKFTCRYRLEESCIVYETIKKKKKAIWGKKFLYISKISCVHFNLAIFLHKRYVYNCTR